MKPLPWFGALTLASWCGTAAAQDLEVFELETFVDPQALVVTTADGERRDLAYVAGYLQAGYSHDFQYRTLFPGWEASYADLVATYVHKRLQGSVRWTGFSGEDSPIDSRAEVQLGRYFIVPAPGAPEVHRVQLSGGVESGLAEATTLGIDWDVSSHPPYDVVGGLSYAFRHPTRVPDAALDRLPVELTEDAHFLSADVRSNLWEGGSNLGFDLGLGLGAVHSAGETRLGTFRMEFRLKGRLRDGPVEFQGVYAPAYDLQGPDKGRRNHELAVLIRFRLFSDILPW